MIHGSSQGLGTGGDGFSAEIWDPETGSFSPTGSPTADRHFHSATLLPDGRVLVIGGGGSGYDNRDMLASAEIWDPRTDTFTPTGSPTEARRNHTATLLDDGRVLIVGGRGVRKNAPRAEVWDPETESFSLADLLAPARFGPTATLLDDGRVLIVGGEGNHAGSQALATDPPAEVWDPITGSSTSAGSPGEARQNHTATRLGDGRVLIVGGVWLTGSPLTEGRRTTVAEVWDPVTASFSPADALDLRLAGHTATLLPDGRVLIVGGDDDRGTDQASAEVWDPVAGSSTRAGSLGEARSGHTATPLDDGRVLIVGGNGGDDAGLISAEIWERGD